MKEFLNNIENRLSSIYNNERHLHTASAGVLCGAIRNDVDVMDLMTSIDNGSAFDLNGFANAPRGHLTDYIQPEFHGIVQSLVDITAGGNGGMASIGRGEFAIAFLSDFEAEITKSGAGDLNIVGRREEVKHNGGKLAVANKSGREVFKSFSKLLDETDIKLVKDDYIPNRRVDCSLYEPEVKASLNALYWQAITETPVDPISDNEWHKMCLSKAITDKFEHVDSLLVMNANNDFIRFFDKDEAIQFYTDKVEMMKNHFEIRNRQNNPVSFYVGHEEVA